MLDWFHATIDHPNCKDNGCGQAIRFTHHKVFTMLLLNPKKHSRFYPDECSREIMLKTIEFFENKGKRRLKADDQAQV
jgi:hypothetical protein